MRVKIHRAAKKGKIRSAKVEADGHVFDSKLEFYFYKRCKDLRIPVEVKPEKFTVLEGFRFHGKAIRAITYTPDFKLPKHNAIVETKGFPNEAFPLRAKMFFKHLIDTGRTETFHQLKNQKEVDAYLAELLSPPSK